MTQGHTGNWAAWHAPWGSSRLFAIVPVRNRSTLSVLPGGGLTLQRVRQQPVHRMRETEPLADKVAPVIHA